MTSSTPDNHETPVTADLAAQSTPEDPADDAVAAPQGGSTSDERAPADHPVTPDDSKQAEVPLESGSSNAEAAKWRRKLREAEAERDEYAATVESMRRTEIERIAATLLAQGADLLNIGDSTVEGLLADNGAVDSVKVIEAARMLQRSRPGLSRHRVSATHLNFGQGASGPARSGPSGTSWAKVLRGQ